MPSASSTAVTPSLPASIGMSSDQESSEPSTASRPDKISIVDLFHQEESPLLRFAISLTSVRAAAEEVVQEGFMKLHQHWNEVENPKAWLYRCVRNLALNHKRDHARETITDAPPETHDPTPLPDEIAGRMEACGLIRMLVAELEPPDRQLIELKYQQHLPYAEISRRTGLGIGNVGYRLHHLLKSLADQLQRAGVESPRG